MKSIHLAFQIFTNQIPYNIHIYAVFIQTECKGDFFFQTQKSALFTIAFVGHILDWLQKMEKNKIKCVNSSKSHRLT